MAVLCGMYTIHHLAQSSGFVEAVLVTNAVYTFVMYQ